MFEKIKTEWDRLSAIYSKEYILLNSVAFPLLFYGILSDKGEVVWGSLAIHGASDVIYLYKNVRTGAK